MFKLTVLIASIASAAAYVGNHGTPSGVLLQMSSFRDNKNDCATAESVKAAQRSMTQNPVIYRSPSMFLRDINQIWNDLDSNINIQSDVSSRSSALMRCDVTETPESYILMAELPGVTKEQIEITVDKELLTIQATKAETIATEGDKTLIRERGFGKATRVFAVPSDVNVDSYKCKLENGVLTLTFSKVPNSTPRKLEIE